jgi:hypothetical protein
MGRRFSIENVVGTRRRPPRRLLREGKTVISAGLTGILNRLGTTAESWQERLAKLKSGRLLGRFFAASRERLREAATRLRVHHLANLSGYPTR